MRECGSGLVQRPETMILQVTEVVNLNRPPQISVTALTEYKIKLFQVIAKACHRLGLGYDLMPF